MELLWRVRLREREARDCSIASSIIKIYWLCILSLISCLYKRIVPLYMEYMESTKRIRPRNTYLSKWSCCTVFQQTEDSIFSSFRCTLEWLFALIFVYFCDFPKILPSKSSKKIQWKGRLPENEINWWAIIVKSVLLIRRINGVYWLNSGREGGQAFAQEETEESGVLADFRGGGRPCQFVEAGGWEQTLKSS